MKKRASLVRLEEDLEVREAEDDLVNLFEDELYRVYPLDTLAQRRLRRQLVHRFFRARNYDKHDVQRQLEEHFAWRRNALPVERDSIQNVIDREFMFLDDSCDRDGRPIMYIHDCNALPTERDLDTQTQCLVYFVELAIGILDQLPEGPQDILFVVDRTSCTSQHTDLDFLQSFASTLQQHYPGRVYKVIVTPTTWLFKSIWQLAKWFFNGDMRARFTTQEEHDLLPFIDPGKLYTHFGGIKEAYLSTEQYSAFLSMLESIAARKHTDQPPLFSSPSLQHEHHYLSASIASTPSYSSSVSTSTSTLEPAPSPSHLHPVLSSPSARKRAKEDDFLRSVYATVHRGRTRPHSGDSIDKDQYYTAHGGNDTHDLRYLSDEDSPTHRQQKKETRKGKREEEGYRYREPEKKRQNKNKPTKKKIKNEKNKNTRNKKRSEWTQASDKKPLPFKQSSMCGFMSAIACLGGDTGSQSSRSKHKPRAVQHKDKGRRRLGCSSRQERRRRREENEGDTDEHSNSDSDESGDGYNHGSDDDGEASRDGQAGDWGGFSSLSLSVENKHTVHHVKHTQKNQYSSGGQPTHDDRNHDHNHNPHSSWGKDGTGLHYDDDSYAAQDHPLNSGSVEDEDGNRNQRTTGTQRQRKAFVMNVINHDNDNDRGNDRDYQTRSYSPGSSGSSSSSRRRRRQVR